MTSEETIFHKIIRRELPAEIVHEDERLIAIRDIQPVAPCHLLIIPKKTLPKISDASAADAELLGHMLLTAAQLASAEGISEDGYRLVINCGNDGGQAVYQLHLHLIGGRSCAWPPG